MKTKTNRSANRRTTAAASGLKRVLVPTDFSVASASAIDYARSLARRDGAELILIHVVMPVTTPDLIYGSLLWDQGKISRAAQTTLKNWQLEVGLGRNRRVRTQVRVGTPWREIIAAAQELKADLIVVPTHGRTGLSHYLMGSTAEQVVRHAACPVLVVRAPKSE